MPESPYCDRSGEQPCLSSPNVDAELAGVMDTSIGHTDERVAALEEGLGEAVAAIHRLSEMVKAASSAMGARVAKWTWKYLRSNLWSLVQYRCLLRRNR